jgi:hypothetical protein
MAAPSILLLTHSYAISFVAANGPQNPIYDIGWKYYADQEAWMTMQCNLQAPFPEVAEMGFGPHLNLSQG